MSNEASVRAPRRSAQVPGQRKKIDPPPIVEADTDWGRIEFLTEPNSPFGDGYSIEKEQAALADMDTMDDPDQDPRWARYATLQDRKERLEKARLTYRLEQGANPEVEYIDANKIRSLGRLVNEAEDTMLLHTKEAFRLFMGRRKDPDGKYQPIIGIKFCAAALRSFWVQTAHDNPYADWALLRASQGLQQYGQELQQMTDTYLGKLRQMEAKGLSFSVLKSADPKSVSLQFTSPYGYMLAELVVDYDHAVRVVKTAVRKGRLTDAEGHDVIRSVTRRIRGWSEEIARFNRFLWRPELSNLCRGDFLPTADDEGKKRREAVTAIFGPVPADIFAGKVLPPHTRRHTQLTDAERALLARIGDELAMAEADAAADAPTDALL
jgi:integrating conjugative element protein (TIGR03761 family)